MTNPVGSSGIPPGNSPFGNDPNIPPPGPPLAADDPWVKNLAILFPGAPLGELRLWASKFRDNMFQAMNNEIQRCLKKAREAAKKFRDVIEGND